MPYCVQCKEALQYGVAVCPSCRCLQPTSARAAALGPGVQIDRGYGKIVVDKKLGSGAMGTVYRAWLFHDPSTAKGREPPTPIALKQLKPQASLQAELRAFFQNEAEALRMLAHPNVVRFQDLFIWQPGAPASEPAAPSGPPPAPILAMEFVEGDTLEEVLSRSAARAQLSGAPPGLPLPRAWSYFQQLLGALAASHALGIIHRDVKPSNVMIRRDGIVKLTDYGIAHLTGPRGAHAPSPMQLAPGTGAYMSPEQVLGRPLDGRSDLYSAGLVFYESLCGRPPFLPSEKSEFALRMDQVETPPPLIRTFAPHLPPVTDLLFTRMLAKHPDHRYSTAMELGEAIRSSLGLPDTPAWRALGEIAQVADTAETSGKRQRLATLRQVVAQGFGRTAPMPARR